MAAEEAENLAAHSEESSVNVDITSYVAVSGGGEAADGGDGAGDVDWKCSGSDGLWALVHAHGGGGSDHGSFDSEMSDSSDEDSEDSSDCDAGSAEIASVGLDSADPELLSAAAEERADELSALEAILGDDLSWDAEDDLCVVIDAGAASLRLIEDEAGECACPEAMLAAGDAAPVESAEAVARDEPASNPEAGNTGMKPPQLSKKAAAAAAAAERELIAKGDKTSARDRRSARRRAQLRLRREAATAAALALSPTRAGSLCEGCRSRVIARSLKEGWLVHLRIHLPKRYPMAAASVELSCPRVFHDAEGAAEKRALLAGVKARLNEAARDSDTVLFEVIETVRDACEEAAASGVRREVQNLLKMAEAQTRHRQRRDRCAGVRRPVADASDEVLLKSYRRESRHRKPEDWGVTPAVEVLARGAAADPHELRSPVKFVPDVAALLQRLADGGVHADGAGIHVTRVENVLNQRLALDFEQRCAAIAAKRGMPYARVVTGFHGTAADNVGAIVHEGLVVPGKHSGVRVATGSAFGNGIYVTPNPMLASAYTRGSGRLLVCAAVPGKAYVCHKSVWGAGRRRHHDSHVSVDGQQIVLFRRSQVLPCYVVHFDTKPLKGRSYLRVSGGGSVMVAEGAGAAMALADDAHSKALRAAMKAARLKNGSYFFGGRFRILDVAPHDEDDDDTPAHLAVAAMRSGPPAIAGGCGGPGDGAVGTRRGDPPVAALTMRRGAVLRCYDGPMDGETDQGQYQRARGVASARSG